MRMYLFKDHQNVNTPMWMRLYFNFVLVYSAIGKAYKNINNLGLMSPMDFTFQSLPYLGYLWRVPTYKLSSPYVGFTRCSFIERFDNLQSDVGFYKQSYDIDVLPLNWRYFVPVSQVFSLFLQSLISLFPQKVWSGICAMMQTLYESVSPVYQYTKSINPGKQRCTDDFKLYYRYWDEKSCNANCIIGTMMFVAIYDFSRPTNIRI